MTKPCIFVSTNTVLKPEDFAQGERNGATRYITQGVPGYYFPVVNGVGFDVPHCRFFGKNVMPMLSKSF
jgi:hypothetical protein